METTEQNKLGFGPFTLSYNRARKIQDEQFVFYVRRADDMAKIYLREILERETGHCVANKDVPMNVTKINEMVPRGGWFEQPRIMIMMHPFGFVRQIAPGI